MLRRDFIKFLSCLPIIGFPFKEDNLIIIAEQTIKDWYNNDNKGLAKFVSPRDNLEYILAKIEYGRDMCWTFIALEPIKNPNPWKYDGRGGYIRHVQFPNQKELVFKSCMLPLNDKIGLPFGEDVKELKIMSYTTRRG